MSDDFFFLGGTSETSSAMQLLVPKGIVWYTPLYQLSHILPLYWSHFGKNVLIDLLKTVYLWFAIVGAKAFWSIYLDEATALVAAFLLAFWPIHDGSSLWFLGQLPLLSLCLFLFAYVQVVVHRRVAIGCMLAGLASFLSYASPPIAVGIFVLCATQRKWREGSMLWAPNIVYCLYYVVLTAMIRVSGTRLPDNISTYWFAKSLLVQLLSSLDAMLGPSFVWKCIASIVELKSSWTGICVGSVLFLLIGLLPIRTQARKNAWGLWIALCAMCLGSLGMFALTGGYPQLAFGLLDRTTTTLAVPVIYGLFVVPMPTILRKSLVLVACFAILGVSVHWKEWQRHQIRILDRIAKNTELKSLNGSGQVFVSGNRYSILGGIVNIDFLAEEWVTRPVFEKVVDGGLSVIPIGRRMQVRGAELIDPKWSTRVKLMPVVVIYDSEGDRVLRLGRSELASYVASLPREERHWTQLVDRGWIGKSVVWAMPRLSYAFQGDQ